MILTNILIICTMIYCTKSTHYDINASTSNWQLLLNNLKPGDTVIMHEGVYKTSGSGYFQLTLNGDLSRPIVIQGATNETRPIIENPRVGLDAQNIMNIQGSNFMLKHLAFTKGSRGVRLGPAVTYNAVFDDLLIYDTGSTAFTANDQGIEYYNITLINTEIKNSSVHGLGGGCVYLGCVNDLCRIRDSLVEQNYCHDTSGAEGYRPGFQVKPGSYNVIIRNNACYKVAGPCVLVYDDYNRGRNLIDGNFALLSGTTDVGIQCTSGVTVTNNVVLFAKLAGIGVIRNSLYPNIGYVRNITISHNTVYMSETDACLRLNGLTNNNILIFNNVLYCGKQNAITSTVSLSGYQIYSNAVNGPIDAWGIQASGAFNIESDSFFDAMNMNFYPAMGSPLINTGVYLGNHSMQHDFNGVIRSLAKPTVGAYEHSSQNNPGCKFSGNFKCILNNFAATNLFT